MVAILMHQTAHPLLDYIDIDLLGLTLMDKMPLPLGKTARPAQSLPIGRTVAGCAKALPVHETFHQPHGHTVVLEPIALE